MSENENKKVIKATTETGSYYLIDLEDGFWRKVSRNGCEGGTERLLMIKAGTELCFPWQNPDAWEDVDYPEVGKHMFISSLNRWWTTTPVVSVEEVEHWRDFDRD